MDNRKGARDEITWTKAKGSFLYSRLDRGTLESIEWGTEISQKIRTGAPFFEKHLLLLPDTGKGLEAGCLVVGTRGINREMASIFKAMDLDRVPQ